MAQRKDSGPDVPPSDCFSQLWVVLFSVVAWFLPASLYRLFILSKVEEVGDNLSDKWVQVSLIR